MPPSREVDRNSCGKDPEASENKNNSTAMTPLMMKKLNVTPAKSAGA
jgi:hypothetical protein